MFSPLENGILDPYSRPGVCGTDCGRGGIGRRSGFKIHRWQHLGSSSLPARTILLVKILRSAGPKSATLALRLAQWFGTSRDDNHRGR